MGTTAGDGPLVGRERELQELLDSLADAARGHGGVHLVIGEPGVGKTRLVAALAEHAKNAGAAVVWTRGWDRAAPAYWPWVEVVRTLCRGVGGDVLRRELGAGAYELVRLTPELVERLPPPLRPFIAPAGAETSEIARFALFDALVALLRARSAERPVVVVIDDLHSVDESSLLALDFVSRMLSDAAVLLVVTMHERTPRRTPGVQAALANIARAGRRLVLGGLDREAIGELIGLASGATAPDHLVQTVHAVTEGNPFFAREILALLLAEGRLDDPPEALPLPDGVRETIRRRLEPLEPGALETLELAAVIGRTFSLPALERASRLARGSVLAALDAATDLGLVVSVPSTLGQYRFGHGLIRETLLAGMPAAARMGAHRAVGETLEQVYRGAVESHLAELAHHFLSAAPRGDLAKAVDYAERAAQRALDDLAYEQAASLFARALEALELLPPDVPRRAALLLGLGAAESRAGRPTARATFEAAAAAARAIGADEVFARAALGIAPFAQTPGHVDDAHVALLSEALERLGPGDSPLRVRLLGSLAVALYRSDAGPRRAVLAREALDMARRLRDDVTLVFAFSSAQLATTGPDTTEQSAGWLKRLFAISDRAGETVMTLAARSRHIDVLLELDQLPAADMAIETLERLAHQSRDRLAAAFVSLHRARRAALEGRFEDAHALIDEVAAGSDDLATSTIPITIASQRVVLSWQQEGPAATGDRVRRHADDAPAQPCWRAGLAACLAAAGRIEEAQLEYDRLAADGFAALPRDNLWLAAMALLTETVASLRHRGGAAAIYAELAPFAGRNIVLPTSSFMGPVEMWLGILARVQGRNAKALEHLASARMSATRNGARTCLVRIAVEEAIALLKQGVPRARERAAALLEQSAAASQDMGLNALLARARRLQARLAAAPPVPVAAAPAADAGRVTTLRRIGDVWMIDDGGGPLHISDGRGVRLLALLLARPGREVHSLELAAAVDRMSPPPPGGVRSGAQATGRDGEAGSHAERARVNVTRAIRSAIKRIAGYDPDLGAELAAAVRTGAFCAYEPDPRRPRHWRIDEGIPC